MSEYKILPKSGVAFAQYTYTDFVDYALTAKNFPGITAKSSKKEYPKSEKNPWAGTHTFEEAIELAHHGWEAGIEQMKEFLDLDNVRVRVENHIVGHAVDVPRFLMGQPDSMVSYYDDTFRDKPNLTIYISLAYNSHNSGKKAMEYTTKILTCIAYLNKSFKVKLVGVFPVTKLVDPTEPNPTRTGFFGNKAWTQDLITSVVIKEENEAFVLNSLAFSFHPAFFRRFWFKHLEASPYWREGYGVSDRKTFGEGKMGDALREVLGTREDALFLPSLESRKEIDPEKIYNDTMARFRIHNPLDTEEKLDLIL